MSRQALWTAWYRWRTTFVDRRGGYLAIVLLLGGVGGLALGALSGARETQSSYTNYLASTNPETLEVFDASVNPALGFTKGFNPADGPEIASLRFVKRALTVVGFDANIDYVRGLHPGPTQPGSKPTSVEGPYGSEFETQDRVRVVSGKMYDPTNAAEAVMNAQAAEETGLKVGSTFTLALNSDAQIIGPATNPPPVRVVRIRVVGIVVFSYEVVTDEYDQLGLATVELSPALTHRLADCCATYSYSAIKVDGGPAQLTAVERELRHVLGGSATSLGGIHTLAPQEVAAARALRPISTALAAFGGLAALAALVIVSQVTGRSLRRRADESAILRALGADPGAVALDNLLGVLGALVVGAVMAAAVAVGVSPVFPFGPVRPVTPSTVTFDWTVLGFGVLCLVVVLGSAALVLALRLAPHRVAARIERAGERRSAVARAAAAFGLSAAVVTGVRFALDPRSGHDRVPVRSAIFGSIVAVAVVVTTVTFASSLNELVSHPRLYGWNWDYTLLSGFSGDEDLPGHLTASLLAGDPHVAAASGVYFASTRIGDQTDLPTIGMSPGAVVAPPILSGHGLSAANQIVLGPQTLSALHEHLGDTVTVRAGRSGVHRLVIVGTATMPALIGPGLGVGAIVDDQVIPPSLRNTQGNPLTGPNAYFIRARGGASEAALASLQTIDRRINASVGASDGQPAGGVIEALRPTEIADSHSIEAIPAVLGAGLAAGALCALGITLVASVLRRRRDLAVLKTLGFAGRQLATLVAAQATVALVIGSVVGVPVGVAAGRELWDLFANQIAAVPSPSVPVLLVVVIGLGAVVLGNVVAALPGRLAARTSTASLLFSE
jgi:hypothetical protein